MAKPSIEVSTTPARHTVKVKTGKKEKAYGGGFGSEKIEPVLTLGRNEDSNQVYVSTYGRPSIDADVLQLALEQLQVM